MTMPAPEHRTLPPLATHDRLRQWAAAGRSAVEVCVETCDEPEAFLRNCAKARVWFAGHPRSPDELAQFADAVSALRAERRHQREVAEAQVRGSGELTVAGTQRQRAYRAPIDGPALMRVYREGLSGPAACVRLGLEPGPFLKAAARRKLHFADAPYDPRGPAFDRFCQAVEDEKAKTAPEPTPQNPASTPADAPGCDLPPAGGPEYPPTAPEGSQGPVEGGRTGPVETPTITGPWVETDGLREEDETAQATLTLPEAPTSGEAVLPGVSEVAALHGMDPLGNPLPPITESEIIRANGTMRAIGVQPDHADPYTWRPLQDGAGNPVPPPLLAGGIAPDFRSPVRVGRLVRRVTIQGAELVIGPWEIEGPITEYEAAAARREMAE